MSDHPIGFLPQPIASAMGFHIAMTTGESTRFSVELISSWPVLLCDLALPNLMKAPDAGLIRCGCRVPSRTSSMHSPEPMGIARTNIRLPPCARWSSRLNLSVTSLIQRSFSDPYVKINSMESGGAGLVALSWATEGGLFDLQPIVITEIRTAKTVHRTMLNRDK